MLILYKLRELPRWKKGAAAIVLLLALYSAYQLPAACVVTPPLPLPGTATTVALNSPRDAAVYQTARQFIKALVADDREKVQAMLTEGHRANWTDVSFLYDRTLLAPGRNIVLGSYRHSVVRYVQSSTLGGETVALVTVFYTVLFKNGETVEGEMQVEENMVLQLVGEQWLIAADQRKIQ
jgi:hypothetical protein